MSEAVENEEEPSIEEILDSIRQIISDDDEEDDVAETPEVKAAPEEPEAPAEDTPEDDEDDIVELTNIVEEEATSSPEPEEEPEDDVPEIEMTDAETPSKTPPEAVAEDVPETIAAPTPVAKTKPEPTAPAAKSLNTSDVITSAAEAAALGAFTELAQKAAIDKSGTVTVEEIVREEIRPMLRNWIDAHLPPMMERLLQDELEKIAKRAMED